jgi:hypothetical protein
MRVQSSLPEPLHIVDLKRMYHDIYDHYSAYDHPTTTGLQIFVHLAGDQDVAAVDGEPMRDREADLRPYWIAVFAFAQTLVVSNLASGRPSLQALRRASGPLARCASSNGLDVSPSPPLKTAGSTLGSPLTTMTLRATSRVA